jgi:hypothetical protein
MSSGGRLLMVDRARMADHRMATRLIVVALDPERRIVLQRLG